MSRKYCPDCGSIITHSKILSNTKPPNEYRLSLNRCEKCSEKKNKDVIIAVLRRNVKDTDSKWEEIRQVIFEVF
ncbi:MAG: hypothetical protein K5793_03780 [Nitrosarchaeum sp.]|nr:hypothetical protein [Nitrosarchaeum sp.]